MAYQIAFDMYESATQQFLGQVLQALKVSAPIPQTAHVVVKVPVENPVSSPTTPSTTPVAVTDETVSEEPVRDLDSLVSTLIICKPRRHEKVTKETKRRGSFIKNKILHEQL